MFIKISANPIIILTTHFQFHTKTQRLKITEKVSFNIAIEALHFERTKVH